MKIKIKQNIFLGDKFKQIECNCSILFKERVRADLTLKYSSWLLQAWVHDIIWTICTYLYNLSSFCLYSLESYRICL